MRRFLKVLLIVLLFVPLIIFADEKKDLDIYLFYGHGCPHCADEEKFLNKYLKEHENVHLHKYEVWEHEDNVTKWKETQKILNITASGVPYLVIGDKVVQGFMEDYTEELIDYHITYYENATYVDKVGIYLGIVEADNPEIDDNKKEEQTLDDIILPSYLEKIVKKSSLAISAIVIGFIDGINPCAMWILLFLISMLITMENKKRKWTLGFTFLISSAAIYFLFLISWLELATFLDSFIYIRLAIAFVAVIFGTYSIVKFIGNKNSDNACEVVNPTKRRKIMLSIKKIVKEKSFFLAIIGIIILACSVNLIELMCSLGLPVLFSQILVINNVTGTGKILYSLLYVFFFLLDDIVIFVISMKTLEIKAISNKIGKYTHLIGGLLMLLIGILMLFKPEWLMFNF